MRHDIAASVRDMRSAARRRPRRHGLTLIEVAVATAIIGVGVTALMVAAGSTTRVNSASRKLTQAVFIAQEVREWTLNLPFSDPDPGDQGNSPGPDGSDPQTFVDDLDDLSNWDGAGITYSPPRDGQGVAMPDLAGWSQTITLTWRNPNDLTQTVAPGASDIINVNVDVKHNDAGILACGWLVTRRESE
jgi:prepilin-type N-terminal cleavage/methylation domain-containing protein